MDLIQLFAQAETQELMGRLGDGKLIRFIFGLGIGFLVGLMAGWLGLKRPPFFGG